MTQPDFLSDSYSEGSLFQQPADPDLALAYRLQNGQADDPLMLEAIVERYAAEITRLAYALLDNRREKPAAELVCELVEGTFHRAMTDLSSFWGQSSVRLWLLDILVEQARYLASAPFSKVRRAIWVAHSDSVEKLWFTPQSFSPENEEESRLWARFGTLSDKRRISLFLRHLCSLEISEIAQILKTRPAQIEKYLQSASIGVQPHAMPQLLDHRWPIPSLSSAQIEQLKAAVRQTPVEASSRLHTPLRGLAFVGGLFVVFVLLFFYINRGDLTRIELPRPAATSTALPLPIPGGAENDGELHQPAAIGLDDIVFSSEPALSADGRYLAFSSSAAALVEGDSPAGFPDIFIYDNQTKAIERINLAAYGQSANGQSSSPAISADGRFVVYASMADNLVEEGGKGGGIYLYDRSLKQTVRIDRAPNGAPADAESLMPAISADGNIIVFWSLAANLSDEPRQSCWSARSDGECRDIYVYERSTRVIQQRIPIGRSWDQFRWDRRLALSADGARLALTIHRNDRIARDLHLTHASEVFVFERSTGEYLAVNLDGAGEAGDGASAEQQFRFSPNISADGQVIAFTSQATNLVEGDTNGLTDVFVRDLKTGLTQRVSVTTDGEQAEAVSGVSRPNLAAWGDTLGLSGDGRYVAFLSESLNLDILSPAFCEPAAPEMCNVVYLHDRLSGETRRLTEPLPNLAYLHVVLSADGQWVGYVKRLNECVRLMPGQRNSSS